MILDIVLIFIILIGVFIGYKKGFVKTIIKLGTFIIAFLIAFVLQSSVADFIGETLGFNNTISSAVENKLIEITTDKEDKSEQDINIPVLEKTINEINDVADEKKEEVILGWSNRVSTFIIRGISFIAVFIVVSILMGIIGLILDTIVELPVLKTLNGILGSVIEVILIVLRIAILLTIISFLSPLDILKPITNYINESCITKWIYENNIIVHIIGRKI